MNLKSLPKPKFAIGQKVTPVKKSDEWIMSEIVDFHFYRENKNGWAYKVETKNNNLESEDAWFWEKELQAYFKN